jgi:mRNA deadenylase 3'-5' endonuclease subunit Ccr4
MPEQSTLTEGDESVDEEDGLSMMRIEILLFPPEEYHHQQHHHHRHSHGGGNGQGGDEPLAISMMRKRGEPATQSLKRLELSLAKKLKTYFHTHESSQGPQRPGHQSYHKQYKKGGNNLKLSALLIVEGEEIKLEDSAEMADMTNEEFWTIPQSEPLQLCLRVDKDDDTTISIPAVVESNPPTVIGVNVFEKFHSKIFPGVPLVVELETVYTEHAVIDWYLDQKLVCHDSVFYTPTFEDANKSLAVVITPTRPGHDGKGYEEAYQFAEKVEEKLPENTMLQTRPDWQLPRDQLENYSTDELRIMSYNILADQNAFSLEDNNQPFFPWVAAETLDRSRRMPLILHEILSYNADVICLQEVDEIIYETLLRPAMDCFNYQSYYTVKCSHGTREGSAIFFSLSRFQRASEDDLKVFEISKLLSVDIPNLEDADEWKECSRPIVELFAKRPDLLSLIEDKLGHVLQVAHLKDLDGNPLLVANTHLFYHPDAAHIRTLQCFAIAHQLSVEQGDEKAPFILCGDFNSELWNCGALLVRRSTPMNFSITGYADWRKSLNTFVWDETPAVNSEDVYNDDFPALWLPKSFPDVISGYPDYPELTHCVVGFQATLDHILLSSSTPQASLTPVRQAPVPSLDEVVQDVAMPSVKFPSDHMSVLSDVLWKPLRG